MYLAYENRPEILDSSKKGFVGRFTYKILIRITSTYCKNKQFREKKKYVFAHTKKKFAYVFCLLLKRHAMNTSCVTSHVIFQHVAMVW